MRLYQTASMLIALATLSACALNPLRSSRLPDVAIEPGVAVETPASGGGSASSTTASAPSGGTVASGPLTPPKPATATRQEVPGPTSRRGAYYMDDGPGAEPAPDHRAIADAKPRREPLLARANRPYVVFGRSYQPMTALVPYRQRGHASWYGRKFHGQKTASGEVYNMYAMTAAHPTLPIPSYVRVTNTRTGERVVVRVNDRGPFLNDRLIDLSYTAAAKLGYVNAGSAEVDVELLALQDLEPAGTVVQVAQRSAVEKKADSIVIAMVAAKDVLTPPAEIREERLQVEVTVKQEETPPPTPTQAQAQAYLQLGAFSTSESAESTRSKVRKQLDWIKQPIEIVSESGLFKLRAGPYENRNDANAMAEKIRIATGSKPFLTTR
jgi:rare lipoprotein A